ncbi:MAG: hypothetical protein AAB116_03140 [Candidatus Poribacteria bacterium]
MAKISEKLKKQIWKEVKEEFPDDEMMQEIHYVRLLHYYQTLDLSPEEYIKFFNKSLSKRKRLSINR